MRNDIERSVANLASRQYGLIGRAQAVALGMTRTQIATKLRNGTWTQPSSGVYAVGGTPPSWERTVMSVVLAVDGVASVITAGGLHGLIEGASFHPIDVTVAHRRRPRATRGRRIHRARALRRSEVTRVAGVPVTSVPRTLLDLAAVLSDERLEAALDRALVSGRTSIGAMRRYLKTSGRTRNVRRLTRLLDDREFGVPESELERAFERLIKRERLPMPVRQRPVSRFRVDYAYVELNIVIEVDGSTTRSTKVQLQRDRRRQNEIVLEQLLILRFTWDDVTKDADYVVATIRRALDGAGGGS